MIHLIEDIKECRICEDSLIDGVNPVFSVHQNSKIAIIGQTPGIRVHKSGVPWQDPSGNALRKWLDVSEEQFYDARNFAIVPMGFCYPGKGKSGDLPPRKECAPHWHSLLFAGMKNLRLILLIGRYAQDYYLKDLQKRNLTETVRSYEEYLPMHFPLPHPSPHNRFWLKKNSWFKQVTIPALRKIVSHTLVN